MAKFLPYIEKTIKLNLNTETKVCIVLFHVIKYNLNEIQIIITCIKTVKQDMCPLNYLLRFSPRMNARLAKFFGSRNINWSVCPDF
jgi:hypothetical protein